MVIIISNSLFSSTTNRIMMHVNTKFTHQKIYLVSNGISISIWCRLIKHFKSIKFSGSMKIILSISSLLFWICSWCKISSPIIISCFSIRKHIIILYCVFQILLLNCINEHSRCWIHQSDIVIWEMRVEVFYKPISIKEALPCIRKSKITPKS